MFETEQVTDTENTQGESPESLEASPGASTEQAGAGSELVDLDSVPKFRFEGREWTTKAPVVGAAGNPPVGASGLPGNADVTPLRGSDRGDGIGPGKVSPAAPGLPRLPPSPPESSGGRAALCTGPVGAPMAGGG